MRKVPSGPVGSAAGAPGVLRRRPPAPPPPRSAPTPPPRRARVLPAHRDPRARDGGPAQSPPAPPREAPAPPHAAAARLGAPRRKRDAAQRGRLEIRVRDAQLLTLSGREPGRRKASVL